MTPLQKALQPLLGERCWKPLPFPTPVLAMASRRTEVDIIRTFKWGFRIMRNMTPLFFVLLFLPACTTTPHHPVPVAKDNLWPNENSLRRALDEGRYHQAMRELPGVMQAWKLYTQRTGETAEGAAGFIFSHTLDRIAAAGDADWGKILDDPQIPYAYKTDLL